VFEKHRVKHTGDRAGCACAFLNRFSKIPFANQIGQPSKKVASLNRGLVKKEEAFCKDSQGGYTAGKNQPH
jgi:hypothetical protein